MLTLTNKIKVKIDIFHFYLVDFRPKCNFKPVYLRNGNRYGSVFLCSTNNYKSSTNISKNIDC